MTLVNRLAILALGAAGLVAPLAQATVVPQQKGNPCDAVWDIGDATAQPGGGKKPYTLTCADGDATCDSDGAANGSCAIRINACVGSTKVAGCTPGALTAPVKISPGTSKRAQGIVLPTATTGSDVCGTQGTVSLPLRGKKKDKPSKPFIAVMTSKGAGGGGRNRLKLVCTKGTPQPPARCSREAPGLPAKIVLQVPESGSDLDTGFTGVSHNSVVTAQAKLNYCLTGCDASTNPTCAASGDTGPGTDNGETFGAPLPLLAANVPVCVVNRFRESPITGTVNLQTGEMQSTVKLSAETYVRLGKADLVCPRCNNGKCVGGRRDGQSCTVNGTSRVAASSPPEYNLSTDCPPEGEPSARLVIDLPLTTETHTSPPGPKPCADVGQRTDDTCPAGSTCTNACPSEVDAGRGGLHQTCCSAPPNSPCFPTKSGGSIVRTGIRAPVTPAWPDPTYPKTSEGSKLVATFCIPTTRDPTVDGSSGLPGPGALILPATQTVTASE